MSDRVVVGDEHEEALIELRDWLMVQVYEDSKSALSHGAWREIGRWMDDHPALFRRPLPTQGDER